MIEFGVFRQPQQKTKLFPLRPGLQHIDFKEAEPCAPAFQPWPLVPYFFTSAPPAGYIMDHFSQLPMKDDHLYRDPDYPWDAYLQP